MYVTAMETRSQPDPGRTLEQILRQAKDDFGCDAASVLASQGRRPAALVACSDAAVQEADQLQLAYAEGPGVGVPQSQDVCLSADTRADARWPRWGPQAAALGWLSVLSAPLVAAQGGLGTLNLYSRRAGAFSAADVAAAGVFARQAGTALEHAFEVAGLRIAIDARHKVGLAQGILMERYGLDVDAAFNVLRRYSQDNNVKLRRVAEHVVATRQVPGPGQLGGQASLPGSS